jgi:hypothetical protein
MTNYKKSLPNDSGSLLVYETAINYQAMRPGKAVTHVGLPTLAGGVLTNVLAAQSIVDDLPLITVTESNGVYIEEVTMIASGAITGNTTNYLIFTLTVGVSGDTTPSIVASGSTLLATTGAIATIAFVPGSPDTITDSGSGFSAGGFVAGQQITISGSTSNDGTAVLASVAAGTLTLTSSNALTAESAGATVTITGKGGFGTIASHTPVDFSTRSTDITQEMTGPPLEKRLSVPYLLNQGDTMYLTMTEGGTGHGSAINNLTVTVHYRIKNNDLNVYNPGVAGSAHSSSLDSIG